MTFFPTDRFRRPLAAGLLALALVATGCAGSDEAGSGEDADEASATTTRSVRVESMLIEPVAFDDVIELSGTVEAPSDATLSAQAAGTVEMLRPLGTYVPAGEPIAQINPRLAKAALQQAEAAVRSAKAQYDLAEDNFRRQEPLYQDSIISPIEYENVRAQRNQALAGLEQAEAALEQAREQLGNTAVTASFGGTVEAHFVDQGEQVNPGTPVARVVNTRNVKVTAGVPERYAGDVEVGTPVRVGFQAYGVAPREGRVSFVGSVINRDNRTFPIEVELDNPDGRLKPEMVATLYVTREALENAVVVPQTAILRDENGVTMFVAETQEDGAKVAVRRAIELGPSYGGRTVVTSGLEPGDEVLVIGQTNVTEGNRLEVVRQFDDVEAVQEAFGGTGREGASRP